MAFPVGRLRRLGLGAVLLGLFLVGCAPASNLSGVAIAPQAISPNGDGIEDYAIISYSLARASSLSITLVDSVGREYSFRRNEPRSAGSYTARFNGIYSPQESSSQRRVMPNGEYAVVVKAVDGQGRAEEWRGRIALREGDTNPPMVNNAVSRYDVISPNGDAIQDETSISYGISKDATVSITAADEMGNTFLLEAPTPRATALYSHDWNGTSGGRLLPDGGYTIRIQAQDKAGNVSEATTSVRIDGGGTPRLDITKVLFTPPAIPQGGTLNVEIWVKNSGTVPLRTLGPPSGTAYTTDMSFNSWKVSDGKTPLYFERAGLWRVGVEWGLAGRAYPVRWGLTPDLSDLMPGQEAVITGTIQVLIEQTREVFFWASVAQEGVGFPGGRVGQQRIVISY